MESKETMIKKLRAPLIALGLAFALTCAFAEESAPKLGNDAKLWLEKYVLGKAINWPAHPVSEINLGVDGNEFVAAEAVIVGDTVEVSALAVPEPKFVRMGWRDVALANLKDKNGWPVFAFASQAVAAQ